MAIIGHFTKQENGSYIGSLDSLTLKGRVTFEPLTKRGEKSPTSALPPASLSLARHGNAARKAAATSRYDSTIRASQPRSTAASRNPAQSAATASSGSVTANAPDHRRAASPPPRIHSDPPAS